MNIDLITESLKFENISSDYGYMGNERKGGFDPVTFELNKEQPIAVITGNNGEGKSSLLKTIIGKDVISTQGKFKRKFNDSEFNEEIDIRHFMRKSQIKTFFIPQNILELFPKETCVETVVELWASVGQHVKHKDIMSVIRNMGLEKEYNTIKYTHCDKISLGQAHLLSFILLEVFAPELILMDEPTASMSLANKTRLIEHIRRFRTEGKFMIIVTHDEEIKCLAVGQAHEIPSIHLSKNIVTVKKRSDSTL